MKYIIRIDKIKNFIEEQNLTKKEFCKRSGVSSHIFNKILKNDINFGVNAILKIANFMNILVSDLINYQLI